MTDENSLKIVFMGKISPSCMAFIKKKKSKVSFIAAIAACVLVAIAITLLGFFASPYIFATYMLLAPLFLLVKYNAAPYIPQEVKIVASESGIVIYEKQADEWQYADELFDSNARMVDCGEFYYFGGTVYAAQKDLLCEGTLEQFEELCKNFANDLQQKI